MGLLGATITRKFTEDNVNLEELEIYLKEKLGDKIKVKFVKKANAAQRMLGGKDSDTIRIENNAYHLFYISTEAVVAGEFGDIDVNNATKIYIDKTELKGFLGIVYSNFGFIGTLIIDLIYGKATEFYKDLDNALASKYKIRRVQIETGINGLKVKEIV